MLGAAFLCRCKIFSDLPRWILFFLAFGLWPVFFSWTGFIGLYRIPHIAECMGAAFALYFIAKYYSRRSNIRRWLIESTHYNAIALGIIFLITQLLVQHCYFTGGVNNWPDDQVRGLSFTSAFAANYLKPAHPIDLSIPLSYGYYLFEYTAFLYSAVDGYSWPSITLLIASIISIAIFYFAFLKLLRIFLPAPQKPGTELFALMAVTFYGFDIFVYPEAPLVHHIEWWNPVQITQMASYWNWVYHYLASAALSMTGLVCLHDALTQKRRDLLITSAAFMCLGPTFAPTTGIFFILVGMLTLTLSLATQYRTDIPRWFFHNTLALSPTILFLMIAILLPQLFTFWGREEYLHLLKTPVLWFSRTPVASASMAQWITFGVVLIAELGTVLFIGLLATPFYIWKMRKFFPFATLTALSLLIVIILSEFSTEAQTNDWYWRSGGFGIILLCPIIATWLFTRWMPDGKPKRTIYWLFMLLLFAPCAFNFYSELRFRYDSCNEPAPFLADINRNTDLHTAISRTPFDSGLVYFAGRIAVMPGNSAKEFLSIYSLSNPFLKQWFGYNGEMRPCKSTWYGSSTPNCD